MCQRWLKQAYCRLRPERHIMQVLKCGKISHIIINLIFGHLGAYFMSWSHWTLHSLPRIWRGFIIEFWREFIQKFLLTIARTWAVFWRAYCRLILRKGHLVTRFYICPFSMQSIMNWNCKSRGSHPKVLVKLICLGPSNSRKIWSLFLEIYLRAITNQIGLKSLKMMKEVRSEETQIQSWTKLLRIRKKTKKI